MFPKQGWMKCSWFHFIVYICRFCCVWAATAQFQQTGCITFTEEHKNAKFWKCKFWFAIEWLEQQRNWLTFQFLLLVWKHKICLLSFGMFWYENTKHVNIQTATDTKFAGNSELHEEIWSKRSLVWSDTCFAQQCVCVCQPSEEM